MLECWYKNLTNKDLWLKDLSLRIPASKVVNLYKLKPNLTSEQLARSEADGLLAKCTRFSPPKIVKLPCAPSPAKTQYLANTYQEAITPIPSRSRTSIVVDQREKDYIEDMEEDNMKLDDLLGIRYSQYSEGIIDPIAMNSERGTFKVITSASKSNGDSVDLIKGVDTTPNASISLNGNRQVIVDVAKPE